MNARSCVLFGLLVPAAPVGTGPFAVLYVHSCPTTLCIEKICSHKGMASDKTILESKLGQLLGFDDGASDVLEHLLTIESLDVSPFHFVASMYSCKHLKFVYFLFLCEGSGRVFDAAAGRSDTRNHCFCRQCW